ncbi:hypothetical protein [Sporisorium scitamineum]|uniref:Uncharacterized protein n=1 Tax=Sporisorium scitamineum TaxID=49012 RepID=A0A0F7SBL4_9BASI|nr:hypothetical protein [Sporisorium scitamineum]
MDFFEENAKVAARAKAEGIACTPRSSRALTSGRLSLAAKQRENELATSRS